MRIPKYDQSVSAAAPQINAPRVADPVDLSQAINFVEGRYEQGIKQQEQDYKLYVANEAARTQLSIDEKYAEMVEALDNGDYEAETKFQKFYDKAVNQSLGRLNGDPAIQESIKLDYQRSGVEYGLRLKDAKRGKLKADAAVGFNQQLNNIKVKVSNAQSLAERQSLLAQAADVYGQAESTNVFAKGAGIVGMQTLVDESVRDYAYNKPEQFLAEHKQNPKSFDGVTDLAKVVDISKSLVLKKQNEAKAFQKKKQFENNRIAMGDVVNNSDLTYEQKVEKINALEALSLSGSPQDGITTTFATSARRLLKSRNGGGSTKIDQVVNSEALISFDKKIDNLSYLVDNSDNAEDVIAALDELEEEITSSIGVSITGAQAVSLSKTASNLFYNRTPSGTVTEFDASIDASGGWGDIAPGIQSPDRAAVEYLRENLPANLVGADKIRYKLDFMNAFDDALGDYASSGNFAEDQKLVSKAIDKAQQAIAVKRNPSLLGVQGVPNKIAGDGKDEVVSSKSTAEAKRSVQTGYTIMEDANGNKAKVYEDGTIEEIK